MTTDQQPIRATVHGAPRYEDRQIQRQIREVLSGDALLGKYCCDPGGADRGWQGAPVLYPEGYAGVINVSVNRGVVRLEGSVATFENRRMATLLAWRVMGCCEVVNSLAILDATGHQRSREPARLFGRPSPGQPS
jgi:hypothetical protein